MKTRNNPARRKRQAEQPVAPRAEESRQSIAAAAWRLLAVRNRSRHELRQRLLRKRYPGAEVEAELDRLAEAGHIDDGVFARSWVAMRSEATGPRGRLALRNELRRKGIDATEVATALSDIDELALARRAAASRAGSLAAADSDQFRRRLGSYLQRRGFPFQVVKTLVEEAWRDTHGNDPDDSLRQE